MSRLGPGAARRGRRLARHAGRLRRFLPRRGQRLRLERQGHAELAAPAGERAAHLDPSAVQLDEAAHERQADPEAALRAIDRALDLREEFEDPRMQRGRDADPRVAHADERFLPAVGSPDGLQRHPDRAPGRGELRRVVEQVADHLREPGQIPGDLHRLRRQVDRELLPARLDQRAIRLDRARHHVVQRQPRPLESELSLGDPRHVEQVLDEARELLGLAPDHLPAPLQLRVLQRPQPHELHSVHDRRERIAQFVGEHGQELVLAPVHLDQGVFQAPALLDLARQGHVRPGELRVGRLELAGLLGLERGVRREEVRVRPLEAPVQILELAALRVQLREHRDLAAQDLRDDRDVDVVDRSERVTLQPVEVGRVQAGHEDDRGLLEPGMIVHQGGQLEAVHAGHAHVQQDQGDFALEQPLERFRARVRSNEVVPEVAQDRLVAQQPRGLVVHEEDPDAAIR